MNRALLTLSALLLLSGPARADHQRGNLRGLSTADLCPPVAYVFLDDEEQEELETGLDEQLVRYATLYSVPFGDPKTCTVTQSFNVDAFEGADGRILYSLSLELGLRGDVRVMLGTRTLTLSGLQLWSSSGYGSVQRTEALLNAAAENVRAYYEDFALDWKAVHGK